MASIVKRKNKWAVIYSVIDENGVKRQKWETFASNADAKKRKAQVEYEQSNGTFIAPSAKTVRDLLEDYVSIYGINTWAPSTYDSKCGLIQNYILPLIGDVKLDTITPRMMDKFYQSLLTVKAKPRSWKPDEVTFLSTRTVKEIHKILRNAFNQAVKWELMQRNPVANCTLPKSEEVPRNIWSAETLFKALSVCDDDILALAINLAFSCSLRMGEMLGLTWDCVDISEESINSNCASIYINKELQRISKAAVEAISSRDIYYTFPAVMARNSTVLVLKGPKTKTSVRRVYLPKTVAEMLVERKRQLDEYLEFFGDEFYNYNLVFCNNCGRPMEGQVINRALSKLIREHDLPKIVFHSLRHTSTTYKLKLSGGDIKAVQGDTGHAQASMVTERYAHILDDDRKRNAERFEAAFYSSGSAEIGETEISEDSISGDESAVSDEINEREVLLKMLEQSPEMMALLKAMLEKKNT